MTAHSTGVNRSGICGGAHLVEALGLETILKGYFA